MDVYLQGIYKHATSDRRGREIAKSFFTSVLIPSEKRRAQCLARDAAPLKLHLGCGNTYLEGWCNVDLARPGRKLDLRWDLRRGLPFPDATVGAVFSEHLFEHIPLPGSLALLKECRRVMSSGGVIRIGVPDLERYILAYIGKDSIIDEVRPDRPSRAIALNEIFYFHRHRTMYDYETLALLLGEAGFIHVKHCQSGGGNLNPQPDSVQRRPETLYVEAT